MSASLPISLPKTQSFFYMPIITYSYYQACKYDIPVILLDSLQTLKNLTNITEEILIAMCNSVTKYLLCDNNNLLMLKKYYDLDSRIDVNNPCVGHINGNYQEKILEDATFIIDNECYKKNMISQYYDKQNINVKEALDFYIISTYHPDFLLTEK